MTKTPQISRHPAALARGAEGKASVHCRKSIDDARRAPKHAPEVITAKTKKAIKKAAKPSNKGNVTVSKLKNRKDATKIASKLILKQNKEVRNLLTLAAVAAGGSRLSPIGFDSYTAFLAGVPLDADGNAVVSFIPVKGNEPIQGKNVKLTIKAGKVVSVK